MMPNETVNPLMVRKYNLPLPRYTSYSTVPFWIEKLETETWKSIVEEKLAEQNYVNGISLYIHLPFCESFCTYCGCNKK